MEIDLTAEFESFIRQQLASGKYDAPSDVVRDALSLLRDQENSCDSRREELRKEIAIGIAEADRGELSEFNEGTVERVKERGRQRLHQRKTN